MTRNDAGDPDPAGHAGDPVGLHPCGARRPHRWGLGAWGRGPARRRRTAVLVLAVACLVACAEEPDRAQAETPAPAGEPSARTQPRAADTLGLEQPAQPGAWFEECALARGIDFTYVSGHRARPLMPEIMGGGAALLDADADGDLDLYLVQGGSVSGEGEAPGNRLYANDGRGFFRDVSRESGADDRGYGMGPTCGDADGDGDTDIYVTNLGANVLLLNGGDGRFREVSESAGVAHPGWGTSAAFLDVDRDGALDLYVCNYLEWSLANEIACTNTLGRPDYCSPKTYQTPAPDVLYKNLGSARFADVSVASGVAASRGNGLGLGPGDFDGDGWVDLFVANDGNPDFLWHNDGQGGLQDVALLAGCGVDQDGIYKAGMGVAVADLDDDLDLDILVCNLNRESDSLFLNEGGRFLDRTARAGLAAVSKPFTRFGMAWADLDQDGLLDLFQANGRVNQLAQRYSADPYAEPNLVFRGSAARRFEEVKPRGGVRVPLIATSRAAVFGDVDGDGAVDVVVVNRDAQAHLLLNRAAGSDAHWILFAVRESSGADALGAQVTLSVGERRRRADVRVAYSYLASNDPRVHFGLGAAERVSGVEVCWMDGERESFGELAADRLHVLRRGQGRPLER